MSIQKKKAIISTSTKHNNLTYEINKRINDALWHINTEHLFAASSNIKALEKSQVLFTLEDDYTYPVNDFIKVLDDIETIFRDTLDAEIEIDRDTASIHASYPDYDCALQLYFNVEYKVLSWKLFDEFRSSYEELKKFNDEKLRMAKIKAKETDKKNKNKKLDEERKLYEKLKKKFKD